VIPLNAIELEVAAESATDAVPKKELALGRVDGDGKSLGELINQPSLNIRGLSSGRIGEQAANIIPATATAALDLRLVKGVTKAGRAERVIAHPQTELLRRETRLAHPRIARVVAGAGGYNAMRHVDLPLAQRVLTTARSVCPLAVQPTSGGSVPLDMIVDILGTNTITASVVNYDNSQHSSNEHIKRSTESLRQ
jgi:acetylornithine deacetylase/succinyl-diaminopimelate desuccinylase-like protein